MLIKKHTICRWVLIFLCSFLMADDSWMIYDDSSVGRVDIYIDPDALNWIYNNVESDSMHVADIHLQNSFIDETVENVGFRLRGNTSRVSQKKSFKLDFNHFFPGRDFYDVEKINLNGEHNDVSIIRSKLAWDLFDSIGMTASRANHVELYINENYYGLYISVEHIDDTFLSKRFQDDSGNLWRCLWPADLTYRGPDPEDYHPWIDDERPYDLKTNEDEYNFVQLSRLVNIINNDPDSLDHVLDITGFIKYLAINILTGSWDDYRSLRNNYYLYYVPNKDQFQFIPYDYDNTFGIDWFDVDWATIDPYSYYLIDNSDRPLADIIMDTGSFRNLFTHFLSFYLEHHFSLELWENWIDSTKFMIDSSAYYDIYRTLDYGFTFDDFTNSYSVNSYNNQHVKNGLKEFIIERVSALENQIDYLNAEPLVYDVWWEPQNPVTGDSITIHAAAFGYPDIDHINVIIHNVNNGSYDSYPMQYDPLWSTNTLEEEDHWVVTIPPIEFVGDIGIRFMSTNTNQSTGVTPITGEWFIKVVTSLLTENVFINEFLARNDATNMDEQGEFDDWLELYNASEDTVILDNHFLTDNPDNLTKWSFPESGLTIAPYEYLLIWCDNDDEQGDIHTNFKLSGSGEFIALTNPDGETIIDSLTFAEQIADISYGRYPDGSEIWQLMNPTPGITNTQELRSNVNLIIPSQYTVYQNYPNPFNPVTTLRYDLPENGLVNITIYDMLGREVKTLINQTQDAGYRSIIWDATNDYGKPVSAGIYLYQIQAGEYMQTKKMVLLK